MTAEVAVMNRLAVALAADSAVTIGTPEGVKLYNTDKLFLLSKYEPVGVMISGNATLMGVPWELIIKSYRAFLGERAFPRLDDYAVDFFSFTSKNASLFPETLQAAHAKDRWEWFLKKYIVPQQETKQLEDLLLEFESQLTRWPRLDSLSTSFESNFAKAYLPDLVSHTHEILSVPNFPKSTLETLSRVMITLGCRGEFDFDPGNAGIVIAGYGVQEVYPGILSYTIDSVVANETRYQYRKDQSQKITNSMSGLIMPFAQDEMVRDFMEGINPFFRNVVDGAFQELVNSIPNNLERAAAVALPELVLNSEQKRTLSTEILSLAGQAKQEIMAKLDAYRRREFIDKVMEIVGNLPKDELASLAESLVYLTSIKKKYSIDAETVGGPIDVAVISRGDGFVWVKRKHYFTAELNPQFFQNYFRRDERLRNPP
jgi:hypothetical protein